MTHWLLNLWHTMYVPARGPFYNGATWGNVFVVAVLAPLGWVWSRTRWFPLRPIQHGLTRLHEKVDGLHARHDQHEQNHAVLLERVRRVGESVADLHEKLDPGPPHRVVDRPRD